MARDKIKKAAYDRKYQIEHKELVNKNAMNFYNTHPEYREKQSKRLKKRRVDNTELCRNRELLRNYGITIEEYNELLFKQNGCCAICGVHHLELNRSLYVDHNHETGEVRGLLCLHCNSTLGYAKDSIVILENAIKYLQN